ncbi:Na+/proline symporter [Aureimonas jatrophae]|nr:Na+/proline symporter [Aureimonas jatrophae]
MISRRAAKGAVGASMLTGALAGNAVVPLLYLRLAEWLSIDLQSAVWISYGIYTVVGAVIVSILVLIWRRLVPTWRRLERWRKGRQTWHRRPSRPMPTMPSPPNDS